MVTSPNASIFRVKFNTAQVEKGQSSIYSRLHGSHASHYLQFKFEYLHNRRYSIRNFSKKPKQLLHGSILLFFICLQDDKQCDRFLQIKSFTLQKFQLTVRLRLK